MTSPATRFHVFAVLYMTAFLAEVMQDWSQSVYPILFLVLVTAMVFGGVTRLRFLLFVIASSAYFLLLHFPEVANHVNLILLCNLALIIGLGRSPRSRHRDAEEEGFEAWASPLRVALILVYFLAGFHKLNHDFFNPDVSCAAGFAGGMLSALTSRLLGVPVVFIVLVAALWVLHSILMRGKSRGNTRSKATLTFALGAAAAVLVGAIVMWVAPGSLPITLRSGLILAMAIFVVCWEVIGSLLLAVPRLQAPVLLLSLGMHAALAPIGFVDFGALALALMVTFVPADSFRLWGGQAALVVGRVRLQRLHVYFVMTAGLISAMNVFFPREPVQNLVGGLLFNLSALVLIWPLLSNLFVARWRGVPVWSKAAPAYMAVVPVLILLHGLTSYFGLRTAGNFSMFSNLRTEGESSNHLLLSGNPLKVWGYQEDAVRFLEIDDEQARIGHKYRPLEGNALPVVEFRKLIYQWGKAGRAVPLTFEYRGRRYSPPDVAEDPVWRTERRDAEMRLMDFRVIQPTGPNRCRW